MKLRIAAIVLLLMAVAAGPLTAAPAAFNDFQLHTIVDDGYWTYYLWDYATNTLVGEGVTGYGPDFVLYPLPYYAYYGAYLYDLSEGYWTELVYVIDVQLY